MASAAEQLARNLNFGTFAKAKALQQRIWFTLGALLVYRFGTYIPVPGIDPDAYAASFATASQGIAGMFNVFAGGAVERMAIFALNLIPYITASIVVQVITTASPRLEALRKEGESGRRKLNGYTRYLAVVFCTIQAYGIAIGLEGSQGVVLEPGWMFRLTTVISLVGGTMFLMWLGEQITERGIGNGISLIIFAGIVANLPGAVYQLGQKAYNDPENFGPMTGAVLLVMSIAVIAFIIMMERGQRRITVQYAKRVVGRRMFGGNANYLPLRINSAGVIPPIFASSILMFPNQIAAWSQNSILQRLSNALRYDGWLYITVYVALIVFFTYFYTAIQFNPTDVADNLKKQNASIPGIRPGKRTAEYIDYVLSRLTFVGSWYISAVCVLPTFLQTKFDVPFYYGGTSLLIVVGGALDKAQQIESHLVTRSYEGFAGPRGPRIRGRRG